MLEDAEREHLQRLVKAHGLAATARLLDISRGVIASLVGGIGVRRGSVELVREALSKRPNGEAK